LTCPTVNGIVAVDLPPAIVTELGATTTASSLIIPTVTPAAGAGPVNVTVAEPGVSEVWLPADMEDSANGLTVRLAVLAPEP